MSINGRGEMTPKVSRRRTEGAPLPRMELWSAGRTLEHVRCISGRQEEKIAIHLLSQYQL